MNLSNGRKRGQELGTSLLIVGIELVRSKTPISNYWSGIALMSDGKKYSGMFPDSGDRLNHLYKISADGQRVEGFASIDAFAFGLRLDHFQHANIRPVMSYPKVSGRITFDDGKNKYYCSPLAFVFHRETVAAIDEQTARTSGVNIFNNFMHNLRKATQVLLEMDNSPPVRREFAILNPFHYAIMDVFEMLFGVSAALVMQMTFNSLCKVLNSIFVRDIGFAFDGAGYGVFFGGITLDNMKNVPREFENMMFDEGMDLTLGDNIVYPLKLNFSRALRLINLKQRAPSLFVNNSIELKTRLEGDDPFALRRATGPVGGEDEDTIEIEHRNKRIRVASNLEATQQIRIVDHSATMHVAIKNPSIYTLSDSADEVKLPFPSMDGISRERWLAELIKDVLQQELTLAHHFYATTATIVEKAAGLRYKSDVVKFLELEIDITNFVPFCERYGIVSYRDRSGKTRFALEKPYKSERIFCESAKKFIDHPESVVDKTVIASIAERMSKCGINPTPEQSQAIKCVLANKLTVINGRAGTGKTFTLEMVAFVLRTILGRHCVITFLSFKNNTVNKLRRTIMSSKLNQDECMTEENTRFMTCDSFIVRKARGNLDTIPSAILIDEAGQVNMQQMIRIINGTTEIKSYNRTVSGKSESTSVTRDIFNSVKKFVMCGDESQLSPINPGKPFSHLLKILPAAKIAQLNVVMRTDNATLMDRISAVQEMRGDDLMAMPVCDSFHMNRTIPEGPRCSDAVMDALERAVTTEYKWLNPDNNLKKYQNMLICCPVNDIRWFVNAIISRMQFGSQMRTADMKRITQELAKFSESDETSGEAAGERAEKRFTNNENIHAIYPGMIVSFVDSYRDADKPTLSYGKSERGVAVGFYIVPFDHNTKDYVPKEEEFVHAKDSFEAARMTGVKHIMIRKLDGFLVTRTFYNLEALNRFVQCANSISVHASQGEEADQCMVIIPKNEKMKHNAVLYTAVSRTKKACVVIGNTKQIKETCSTQTPEELSNVYAIFESLNGRICQ